MVTGKSNSEEISSFNKKDANKCHLALCIYPKAIRLGISHLGQKKHIYRNEFKIKSWKDDLEPFMKFEFEGALFKKVTACLMNQENLIVPKTLFSEDLTKDLYFLNHPKKRGLKLKTEKIGSMDAHNIFCEVKGLEESLVSSVKNYRIKHYQSILLEVLSRETKNSEEDRIYLHCNQDSFDLIIFCNSRLILCNNFKYQSTEDLLYFFLNTLDNLQLSLDKSPVFLSGEINDSDQNYLALKDYCNELLFMNKSSVYQFHDSFSSEHWRDFVLFNQVLCG